MVTIRAVFSLFVLVCNVSRAEAFEVADGDVPGLIAALDAARDGDVIDLAPDGRYVLTGINNQENGRNGLPVIRYEIKIRGHGATIQRNAAAPDFRIFYVVSVGQETEFVNLTIKSGSAGYASRGGGMYIENASPQITNVTFRGNAGSSGGGLYNAGGSPDLTLCSFEYNWALHDGGGMYNEGGSPSITNCTFESNDAVEGNGGGMFNEESQPIVRNSVFKDNRVEQDGGGIFNWASDAILEECLFEANNAFHDGGGIYSWASNITIRDSVFRHNDAMDFGGAMYHGNSSPEITACLFEKNQGDWGGGVYNSYSSATIKRSHFTDNTGTYFGGGIYNINNSHATIDACEFYGNWAGFGGGGMANLANSNAAVTDSAFRENEVLDDGGAIFNEASSPTFTNCVIAGNLAWQGGGMHSVAGSNPAVRTTLFCGNEPNAIEGPWSDLGANQFREGCGDISEFSYRIWVRDRFDESEWDDEESSGPLANPAGDRLANLLKYALGLDPRQSYGNALPVPEMRSFPGEDDDETFLTLTFSHPSVRLDIAYEVQVSSDLHDWSEPAVLVSTEDDGTVTTRTYRTPTPVEESGSRFMRLVVNRL